MYEYFIVSITIIFSPLQSKKQNPHYSNIRNMLGYLFDINIKLYFIKKVEHILKANER